MAELIIKPTCDHTSGGTLRYVTKAEGPADIVHFWKCVVCNELFEKQYFKKVAECSKHMFEFLRWRYKDDPWRYVLGQVYICFNCGKEYFEPMDVRSKGMKGGVPDGIDHPLVRNLLEINEDVLKRVIHNE